MQPSQQNFAVLPTDLFYCMAALQTPLGSYWVSRVCKLSKLPVLFDCSGLAEVTDNGNSLYYSKLIVLG